MIQEFLAALGFLTRMGPCRTLQPEGAGRSLAVFPLVGLALGLVLVLPFALGLCAGRPLVQAWLMTAGSVWLTRGLHLDGVADLCDGVGPGVDAQRFWAIVKDSRVGAFGVLGLVLALGGQAVLLAAMLESGAFGPAVYVFVLGRACAVALGIAGRGLLRPGLGSLFLAQAPGRVLAGAAALTALPGFFLTPLRVQAGAWVLSGLGLWFLLRLARRVQGLNGDFLGAAVVWGELAAGLAFAALA